MSKRHEKRAVRRDHERRAYDKAREVLVRSESLGDLPEEVLDGFACRRANNMASCSCPLCKRARTGEDGLSRKDLRRLGGREQED